MTRKFYAAFALFACLLFLAAGAYAQPICIGLQEAGVNGGAITQVVGSGSSCPNPSEFSGVTTGGLSYGTFGVTVSAYAVPYIGLVEPDEQSTSVGGTASSSGTLNVYVTVLNEELDAPPNSPAVNDLLSEFTDASVGVFTVTETTWYDPLNGVFTETPGDKLGSTTFASNGLAQSNNVGGSTALLSAGWSETIEYTITATGAGGFNDGVDIQAVPEPASIAMLGSGLLGLAGFARRRFSK